MNKKILIVLITIISLILLLFLIRLASPNEIDDVSPEIPCSEKYLEKSDILWVIPKFNNKSILENKTWCEYVLNLNKTLGLHGVYHDFNEFKTKKTQEDLREGINIFEQCFGTKPEIFKPPRLKISEGNKQLVRNNGMMLKGWFNQLTHKVYHCNDAGLLPNWIIDIF